MYDDVSINKRNAFLRGIALGASVVLHGSAWM